MARQLLRILTLAGLVLSASARGATSHPVPGEDIPERAAGDCVPLALANGVAVTHISASTGGQVCYSLEVGQGATQLKFELSGGTGDADLYVKFGSAPTSGSYDCRPLQSGNAESCTFVSPSVGTYYVMINAFSTFSGVQLVGSFTASSGNVLTHGVESASYSGASGAMRCFTLSVPAGKTSLVFNQAGKAGTTGDADLYVKFGSAPNTNNYTCRPYLSGSNEACTINNPNAGTWYACSYGFSTYTAVTMKGSWSPSP
ncbi:PPC domain-containing protein [Archangium lipolyticum]|uniref:PPC domain-containing protein n=1 Tax=Archangium lipolyticum TaxID=2970465 RepID=UPI0027D47B72|nr:PPC domain-containing protein [Archangium lipolyticum]